MKTSAFTEAMNALNSAQRQAVESIEGAVMVIAGPGTGKTQILTLRIANILLKTHAVPESILALTFTESGVHAMRTRLVDMIGTPGYRVEINTFHGFCNELIKNNPEDFPRLISSDNADDVEQLQIIEDILSRESLSVLTPFGDPLYYVRSIRDAIGELKKEGVTAGQLANAVAMQKDAFEKNDEKIHAKGPHKGKMKSEYQKEAKYIEKSEELAFVYEEYQKELAKRKLYDFNDMLMEVVQAFKINGDLLLRTQEQYQYILVDEHQDTNSAQNTIIEYLCNYYDNPNLFVVGDEKQSIYRFQGASLENFLYFKKLYPDAVLIHLTKNYRSSQIILDASGSVIMNNRLAKEFMPENAQLKAQADHKDVRIRIVRLSDYYGEYYYLADEIKKRIEQGVPPKEIAVLAKENRDVSTLVDVFDQKEIPYVLESNVNILADADIQKLLTIFRAIHSFGSDMEFIHMMHVDTFEVHPLDIVFLLNEAKAAHISVWEYIASGAYLKNTSLKHPEAIGNAYALLLEWNRLSHNEHFDVLFKHVIHHSGLMRRLLTKKNSLMNLDTLTGLYEDVKQRIVRNPSFSIDDFMTYIDLLDKHQVRLKRTVQSIHTNAVRLMTAHKSKGLEFDLVYIINAFDGHWGNTRRRGKHFAFPWEYIRESLTTLSEEEKNEDERRLFYVALTRARKEVHISLSTHDSEGAERVPSQFVEEILDVYKDPVDTAGFDTEFLNQKHVLLTPSGRLNASDIAKEYLENKDVFANIFSKKGFAATHLNNYLACPWRYFFRNLLNVPEVMNKNLMYGSAMHAAIHRFVLARATGNPGKDDVAAYFTEALERQPLDEKESKELYARGSQALFGYYEERMRHWDTHVVSELKVRGVQFSEGVTLSGTIDLIEPVAKTHDVIVTDFKTGKVKSRGEIEGSTKSGSGDYKRQLVFYALLLDRYKYNNMHMKTGIIDFLEPTESGLYKREVFEIQKEEIRELETLISTVTGEILSMSFWDKGCHKKDCEYCRLRSFMDGV